MADPFLSEIKIMSFPLPPKGWALANGQFLPINQNQALFSLLGTTYGGNGQTTFALPNLRGQVPIHMGQHTLGEKGGTTSVTLNINQLPTHNHFAVGLNQNGSSDLSGITPTNTKAVSQALVSLQAGGTTPAQMYGTGAGDRSMAPSTISNVGGSQAHNNMMPYLTLSFCIALQGIFPSQN